MKWPNAFILAVVILCICAYAIVDRYTLNQALGECAKAGGNIHVSWNWKYWCDRNL